MQFRAFELRSQLMRVCHQLGEPQAARVALVGCCYGNIIKHLRGLPSQKRELLTREFFKPFPNGERLGKTAAAVVSLDFSRPSPLRKLTKAVTLHLQGLGLEPALVEEVRPGEPRDMNPGWADAYKEYRRKVHRPSGPLAMFLHEAVDAAILSLPRTSVGVLSAWELRDLVLTVVWGIAAGANSPWDLLAEVMTAGWVPVGLSVDGAFLVSRLNEGGPDRDD